MCTGETLKHLRLLKDLSQKGTAKKLGISQPAYSKLEKRKKVNPEQLKKIMDILKCSSDEINVVKKVQH
jgi:transcriptional regulator with XRE-family HTH domain